MLKQKFQVEGMHCTSCALTIDEELEELKGVKRSKTVYARQITEVEYDEKVIDKTAIVEVIGKNGYTVKEFD